MLLLIKYQHVKIIKSKAYLDFSVITLLRNDVVKQKSFRCDC